MPMSWNELALLYSKIIDGTATDEEKFIFKIEFPVTKRFWDDEAALRKLRELIKKNKE